MAKYDKKSSSSKTILSNNLSGVINPLDWNTNLSSNWNGSWGVSSMPYTTSTFNHPDQTTRNYIDFICKLLELDMSFEKYSKMTEDEQTSFIRSFKISNIIK